MVLEALSALAALWQSVCERALHAPHTKEQTMSENSLPELDGVIGAEGLTDPHTTRAMRKARILACCTRWTTGTDTSLRAMGEVVALLRPASAEPRLALHLRTK
jgi:hypothetical protein